MELKCNLRTFVVFIIFAMIPRARGGLGEHFVKILEESENPNPEEAMKLVISNSLTEHDVKVMYLGGNTPLTAALDNKHDEIALELMKICDVNLANGWEYMPLHVAANNNLKNCVEELIKRGALLEVKNSNGFTPLFSAISDAEGPTKVEVVKMLLNAGASAHTECYIDDDPFKLIHCVAENKNAPVAELLLSKGVDVNEIFGHQMWWPLDIALLQEERNDFQKATVIVFLNNGAEQTVRNSFENISKRFWITTSRDESFSNYDEYILKNIRENLTEDANASSSEDGDIFSKTITTTHSAFRKNPVWDIEALVEKYDEKGAFALYRILKFRYFEILREKPQSNLEHEKIVIMDSLFTRLLGETYLGKMPVEIAADIFYFASYYGWKLERLAFNVILATNQLRIGVDDRVKKIAYDIFLKRELSS